MTRYFRFSFVNVSCSTSGRFSGIKTAFEKYTTSSAKAGFWENKIGRIEDGFLADGFLSDRNIFELNNSELAQFKPKAVIFNGQINNLILD